MAASEANCIFPCLDPGPAGSQGLELTETRGVSWRLALQEEAGFFLTLSPLHCIHCKVWLTPYQGIWLTPQVNGNIAN